MKKHIFGLILSVAIIFLAAIQASALTLGFERITGNNVENVATQLFVDVKETSDGSDTFFTFTFRNQGPISSVISEIYFDDLAVGGFLTGTPTITNNPPYVIFSSGAKPENLPSGKNLDPDFTADFAFQADQPSPTNGVGPGEAVIIKFQGTDVFPALSAGDLRIGLHVQSIGSAGGSDSFVNNKTANVPEPTTLILLGFGLVGMALVRRKK